MEHEITTHKDLTSLEFELLEELPKLRVLNSLITDDETKKQEELFENINDNLREVIDIDYIFEVIYERDDGFICSLYNSYNSFLFIKNFSNMEVGEMYFFEDDYIIKINKEFIDDKKVKEFFGEMNKWVKEGETDNYGNFSREYDDDLIGAEDIKGGEINFKVITEAFEEHKLERIKEEKEIELRETEEEEEKEVKEGENEIIYKSKGTGTFGNYNKISVVDKIIKDNRNDDEYILEDNINKIFSYNDLNRDWKNRNDTILNPIEIFLNDKKATYTKKKENGTIYKVVYADGKCKINEVNIPTAKIRFILNKISWEETTKDEIKVLVKLNGMKADFVGLENLQHTGGGYLKIPIINKAIDDKTFKVEFLGKKKTFDWDRVKYWFFWDGSSRSMNKQLDNNKLLKFSEEMGANKKELFLTLKRIKMLNALENEDKD